jgi:DNA (cytosine-5)-methyltransferase 1
MIFKLGELFCGPGGLALGAGLTNPVYSESREDFSISHIWGVDKDPAAINSYNHNIAKRYGGVGLCLDAMQFCEKDISNQKRITALAFGFPCNDFSLVGEQKGVNGQYGELYKAGIKVIEKANPFWFIAENVSGIHSANQGEAFRKILGDLKKAGEYGYKLTAHLYRFEDYGIPQYRHRFIIVGIRNDKHLIFKVPAPTHGIGRIPFVSVKKALEDIRQNAQNTELTRQAPRIVQRLKFTPPWKNAWFLDELIEMKPKERLDILQQLPWYEKEFSGLSDYKICQMIDEARLRCTKARMSHIYRRLDPKQPSYTITGSGGGGTHVYHWLEHRALTNRERARLQSFPDWFEFQGSKEEVRKQIGMAVPPEGAKIIFKAILQTFANVMYKSIESNYPVSD